jgi:RsiW-degrading membrane proteinase PrsW (M82 family)
MATTTLVVTIIMAFGYLLVVRLVDFNEKEPWWAVMLTFVLGAASASLLLSVLDTSFLELHLVPGVAAKELARFGAIGAGVGVLVFVGQRRGFSEINGLMDGVVYGASGGLGFATGLAFARAVLLPSDALALAGQSALSYSQVALGGLADGVFGAFIGIGFVFVLEARSPVARSVAPLGGYLAACVGHLGFLFIGKADPFGAGAVARKWVALLLPVVLVVVVVVVALGRERRAIEDELEAEAETGAVSARDLELLQSFWARERSYWAALLRGSLSTWSALHGLHNRQVQLALAKHKAKSEADDERRAALGEEVAELRESVLALKRKLEGGAD